MELVPVVTVGSAKQRERVHAQPPQTATATATLLVPVRSSRPKLSSSACWRRLRRSSKATTLLSSRARGD
jgi:hypothetical protein